MRIGLLAMSGLRAHDPQLLELGLTLPGVVERGIVVTSMPCLGLLWLASVTPPHHHIQYFEAEHARVLPDELFDCDLVAISALTAQAFEAYDASRQLRSRGIMTAIGGLHATVCPDEALRHFDLVFVGEGEITWPLALAELEKEFEREPPTILMESKGATHSSRALDEDFKKGTPGNQNGNQKNHANQKVPPTMRRLWRADEAEPVDLNRLPPPRYDLLKGGRWNRFPVQASRGCPWRCDFCASSIMLERPYRKRLVEHIILDIHAVKATQGKRRPFIELADDNTFVDKAWGRELCEALIPENVKWFTETDITVADDGTLLRLLRKSRCRQLLIGLESPSADDLAGIELKTDFKKRSAVNYVDRIRRIQDAGVTVNGCFVLGLDHHGPEIFQQVYDFAMSIPLFEVQVTVMTPFPGTPLYDRLLNEDRILEPGRWDLCTLFDVNYRPRNMTVEQLRKGFYWLVENLYSPAAIDARRRPLLKKLWNT